MTFKDLGLTDELLRAVGDAGYEAPTPIQEKAIPYVLMNRDVLGCAQTGTGKTASFVLPLLDILAEGRARARMPRSLILEPTRELAAQVADNFELYGKYQKLSMALLIGGVSFAEQEKRLDRGVDVLIATPGRLLDHFERGKVLLSDVKILVIDEADRMLDMGFVPDVERIVGLLPKIRQTLMFSATMPPEIRRLADQFLMNPKEISVAPPATAAETVEQQLIVVHLEDKRKALRAMLKGEDVKNALIFCNRKRDVGIVHRSLLRHGFDAGALHGDMDQWSRMDTLEKFKNGEIKFLVCSDVAARGLDIEAMSHVFNFDVPISADDYVHRIGRTGRAGRKGRAITIAAPTDGRYVASIEKLIGTEIPRMTLDEVEPAELSEDDGRRRGRRRDTAKKPQEKEKQRAEDRPKEESPRGARTDRPRRGAVDRERGRATARQQERTEGRRPESDQDDHRPFGEHDEVPAFLLRPVRI